jgi:CubicO group peptidase (beta-lactamase class C family)
LHGCDISFKEGGREMRETSQVILDGIDAGLHYGAQLYVSMKGKPVAEIAFGEASDGVPMQNDTIMHWYSAVKPVVAMGIGLLMENGELELDHPVARFIPLFGSQGKESVSIRQLLTHTGGFPNVPIRRNALDWDEIIHTICNAGLSWQPGEEAGYHVASSWYILGEIIRILDGRTCDRFVRQMIFEPSGMMDSWLAVPPGQYQRYGDRMGAVARMGSRIRGVNRPDPAELAAHPRPGGGGRGPVRELGRFYEVLLQGGTCEGRKIFSESTVDLFRRPHRLEMYDRTFSHVLDWGLGIQVNSWHHGGESVPYSFGCHASEDSFGHCGHLCSSGWCDPLHELVITVVFNGQPTVSRHHARMNAVHAALYQDLELA